MTLKITVQQYQTFCLLHQNLDLLIKCEEKASSKSGISREQYNVLMSIKFSKEIIGEEIIMSNLAYLFNRSHNSISTIVDRMAKDGLIKKTRNLPDRRSVRLRLTDKANLLLKKIAKPQMKLINDLFSVFSDEELATLNNLLEKLQQNANKELKRNAKNYALELKNYSKMLDFLIELNNRK